MLLDLWDGVPVIPAIAVLPTLLSTDLLCCLKFLEGTLNRPGADLYKELPRQLITEFFCW